MTGIRSATAATAAAIALLAPVAARPSPPAAVHQPPAATAHQPPPPAVDGLMDEWADVPPAWADTAGDAPVIDFGRVWLESDAERITFRLEVGTEMNLQGGNSITLLIDGDGDATTGLAIEGIGAELSWTFGRRAGTAHVDGRELAVEQNDVGMRQAPTVSSREFEVSFRRQTADGKRLLPGPTVSVVLLDEGRPEGDRLPDEGALGLELSGEPPPPSTPVALERHDPDDVRVLTWNVLFDGLFKRPAEFIRVLRAIDPDVICFQEIWAHTARQAADQVSLALPHDTWHGASIGEGHVVSRYPIAQESSIDEAGNYWALVDLPDERYEVDLSIVSAHPPCCDNEEGRQRELDGIAAWLREITTEGPSATAAIAPGDLELLPGTPIVVAGDMNLVGRARQIRTLLDGQIVDEGAFGPSHEADWDGTPLADAWPRLAGGNDVFTWRDAGSSFAPGKLDYIVYSDSVLELANAFVLATEELTPKDLARYGLRREDTLDASDHLPVVADFTPVRAQARTEAGE